jgi:hypothetical protein
MVDILTGQTSLCRQMRRLSFMIVIHRGQICQLASSHWFTDSGSARQWTESFTTVSVLAWVSWSNVFWNLRGRSYTTFTVQTAADGTLIWDATVIVDPLKLGFIYMYKTKPTTSTGGFRRSQSLSPVSELEITVRTKPKCIVNVLAGHRPCLINLSNTRRTHLSGSSDCNVTLEWPQCYVSALEEINYTTPQIIKMATKTLSSSVSMDLLPFCMFCIRISSKYE